MFCAQAIKYPLGGMVLLAMHIPIPVEPGIDDLGEPIQLRPLDRNRPPVTGRHREGYRLVDSVARDVEMACRRTLAHAVGAGQTNLPVKFHGIDLHVLPAAARRTKWPVFTPPAAGLSRRYRGRLLHRRSQVIDSGEDVGEVSLRIEPIVLGYLDDGHRIGQSLAAGVGTCK